MLILIENIYITISNVNVSKKRSCPKDFMNILIANKIR